MVDVAPVTQRSSNWRERISNLRGLARSLGAYLVFPNGIFVLAGHFVFLARPLINADYLVLGCVAPFLRRRTVGVMFGLLLAIDCFVSLAPVFHFDLGVGAFSVLGGVTSRILLNPLTLALIGGIVLVAVVGEKLSRTDGLRLERVAMVVTLGLVVGLDVMAGTNSVQRTDGGLFGFNIATSTFYLTATSVYRVVSPSIRSTDSLNVTPVNSATAALRQSIANGASTPPGLDNIVLVIVESFGHFRDGRANSLVLEPLLTPAIRARYAVRVGTAPAYGATTSGEVRELCGVRGDFLLVQHIDTRDCLPAVLRRRGYHTTAIHGYTRALYDRLVWYPRVGFDQMLFGEDLAQIPNTKLCGTTFHGVCDADVIRMIEHELLHSPAGEHRFLYWLTLDSHLPVDLTNVPTSMFACEKLPETRQFADVCDLVRLQQRVLRAVAAWATNPGLAPTRFILVGDHAPPFFSREKRALFDMDKVPFIELVPRLTAAGRPIFAASPNGGASPGSSITGH